MHTISEKKLLLLRPSDIYSSPDRARNSFDGYELHSLAASMLSNGVLEPLAVRREGKNKYTLISGERRLKAARIAGLRRVPCVVHNADEKQAAIYSLAANLGREDLNFFEQAQAINRIIGAYSENTSDLSQRLGVSRSALESKLKLLKIPKDCRERILSAGLSEAHAKEIAGLKAKEMPLVLDSVISENLSVKQTRELILSSSVPKEAPIVNPAPTPAPPVRKSAIGDIKMFSNSLTKLLLTMQNSGIHTNLTRKETNGFIEYKIRIENKSEKQLSFSGI